MNKINATNKEQTANFCFQTEAWDRCVQRVFELQQVHRQKDKRFITLLNKIRVGEITDEISDALMATAKQKIETDGILATRLCSHTQDANIINESKLNALSGEQVGHHSISEVLKFIFFKYFRLYSSQKTAVQLTQRT